MARSIDDVIQDLRRQESADPDDPIIRVAVRNALARSLGSFCGELEDIARLHGLEGRAASGYIAAVLLRSLHHYSGIPHDAIMDEGGEAIRGVGPEPMAVAAGIGFQRHAQVRRFMYSEFWHDVELAPGPIAPRSIDFFSELTPYPRSLDRAQNLPYPGFLSVQSSIEVRRCIILCSPTLQVPEARAIFDEAIIEVTVHRRFVPWHLLFPISHVGHWQRHYEGSPFLVGAGELVGLRLNMPGRPYREVPSIGPGHSITVGLCGLVDEPVT